MSDTLRFISKYPAIVLLAGVITLSLFYAMQLLIMTGNGIPQQSESVRIADITMPDFVFDVIKPEPKPLEPEMPPEIPDDIPTISFQPIVTILPVIPQSGQKAEIEDWSISGPVDGNALPLARIEPTYPNRAASRGIEGFVIVEFDVSETGQVINAFLLGAEPPAVFNRAALRAIERWKYNPRIVNGKAVKMTGLRTRFSFSLRE